MAYEMQDMRHKTQDFRRYVLEEDKRLKTKDRTGGKSLTN